MSKVRVVGGKRSGEYIEWFGNRVAIDGVIHELHRVWFTDGTPRSEYYVAEGCKLALSPTIYPVRRVEVCG